MIGKLIDRLDSFFGRLHFRYLGPGALLAWVYCTWFANGIFNVGETRSAILSLWASLLASAIALFSMAFRPNKRTPLSERTISTAGFVMAACTLFASCREGALRSCGAEYNRRHCIFGSLGGVGRALLSNAPRECREVNTGVACRVCGMRTGGAFSAGFSLGRNYIVSSRCRVAHVASLQEIRGERIYVCSTDKAVFSGIFAAYKSGGLFDGL